MPGLNRESRLHSRQPNLTRCAYGACFLNSPKYYVAAEGLLVKGEPGWEAGGKKSPCWDPKYTCAKCEPDLIDSPPKYLDGYCESPIATTHSNPP